MRVYIIVQTLGFGEFMGSLEIFNGHIIDAVRSIFTL